MKRRPARNQKTRAASKTYRAVLASLDYRYVDTDTGLREVVDSLLQEPRFALDTEFHRERTYRLQVALIQVAWPGELALIDPLAVDTRPFAEVLKCDRLMVAHAASQDLEVLHQCCGELPQRIFDTQIAAGFLGGGIPALASLYETEMGWRPPKGDRLTDWLARPLKKSQLDYAACDVVHLLEIHTKQAARLEARGRTSWAEQEFELLLQRGRNAIRPEDAWARIKEVRFMRRRDLSVLRAVAMWRERRASQINQPVRHVMSDMVIAAIARASPRSVADLAKVRGVDKGLARGRLGKAILASVAEGRASNWRPPKRRTKRTQSQAKLRPAVGLVSSWVVQLARERKIEPSLLATRADIEAFVRGDEDSRLTRGWRCDLLGEPIRRLLEGDAALAFDGDSVVLEERSRKLIAEGADSAS